MRLLSTLLITVLLSACGVEAEKQITAEEGTPVEVVESATGKLPTEARIVDSTAYMSVVFQTNSMSTRGHLLDVKRAMRVLLDEYPNIDSFFFGWKHEDNPAQFYMKLNFSRAKAVNGDWLNMMVDEIPSYADDYWLIPALR